MSQQPTIHDEADFAHQAGDEPEIPQQATEKPHRAGWAIWAGSAATHGAALTLMALIYVTASKEQDSFDGPPINSPVIPVADRPIPPPTTKITENLDIQLPTVADEIQPITPVDLIVEDPGDESDSDVSQLPKGDKSAQTDVAMSFTSGTFMAIGSGSNSAGKFGDAYGKRGKRGRKGPDGAPQFTRRVTDAALNWFKRHQSPDGRWDADGYFQNCTDGVKCEPGKNQSGDTDIATTAYAILSFLGDGYDHQTPNTHRKVVKKGLEFLITSQKPDGLLGERNYEHAIATMALAQAYGMVPDPWLREPTQKAVSVILARQNRDASATAPYDRLGWDYSAATGRNDASVTGWNVMALKAAMVAGLKVDEGLTGSKAWLDRSWKASNTGKPWCASTDALDPYTGITRFAYVWKAGDANVEIAEWDAANKRPASIDSKDMAPVGLMSAVFLGHRAGDPMLESLGNYVSQHHTPKSWPCNTYSLYYSTLGLYQLGGERWQRWAKDVLPMLAAAQRQDESCLNGSWDWEGTKFHGNDTGRVLSTAYAALSMQVYWLYERTTVKPAGKKL